MRSLFSYRAKRGGRHRPQPRCSPSTRLPITMSGGSVHRGGKSAPRRQSPVRGASSRLPPPRRIPAHSHPLYRQLLQFTGRRFCIHKSTLRDVPIREWCNKIHPYFWNINFCLQRNIFFYQLPSQLARFWRALRRAGQRGPRHAAGTLITSPHRKTSQTPATAARCFSAEESKICTTRGKMGENRNFLCPYFFKKTQKTISNSLANITQMASLLHPC